MKETIYFKQVELLLYFIPIINKESVFAIKGGTAINLFVRDMPRLSVDIDLAYLPIEDRETTLLNISLALERIKETILRLFSSAKVKERQIDKKYTTALIVEKNNVLIKIETNTVFRGSVYPCETRSLSSKAVEMFEQELEANTLSFNDLYGGKICAALDRQHPRDFFDIKLLLDSEGISEELMRAFIVYLISNNRPILELLNPNKIDIRDTFEKEFLGMTIEPVKFNDLVKTRDHLIEAIQSSLTKEEKDFLISFKSNSPKWNLLGIEAVENLPSVQWKLLNLSRMDKDKHRIALKQLESFLESL